MELKINTVMIPDYQGPLVTACRQVEKKLAKRIEEDTRQYLPYKTGTFQSRTVVNGNEILYNGPQAWYLWYGKRMVNAKTGRGPRYIPNVGWRWPAGARLRPTSDPLHYTKTPHAKAGPRWTERSEAANADAWRKFAEEHLYETV